MEKKKKIISLTVDYNCADLYSQNKDSQSYTQEVLAFLEIIIN
jgi:hypothetical protein